MVMTLTTNESGLIQYNKRPGAVLDAGSLIARLELDDASKVTRAQPFHGRFPDSESSLTSTTGDKLNQVYQACKTSLENNFAGWSGQNFI